MNAFNAGSRAQARSGADTASKFGISFTVAHFNCGAGALVHIYTDGSILVNHGGTEMGQGPNTKVAQVVAHMSWAVAFPRMCVTATDTSKVANTSATAALTGADLNGKAAQDVNTPAARASGRMRRTPAWRAMPMTCALPTMRCRSMARMFAVCRRAAICSV